MSGAYQAVFDAVKTETGNLANSIEIIKQEICFAVCQYTRPSAVYRPLLMTEGNKWCAIYGANIQNGVCGFGISPEEAMRDFDIVWITKINQGESI